MDDDNDKKNGGDGKGKVIEFPNGKKVSSEEIGTPYVTGQGGLIPTSELVDPLAVKRDLKDREEYVRKQPLVQAVERGADTRDMINVVLKEVADELAHLKYEREKAAKDGKNTANYTISRIASLRSLADVLIKRSENLRAEQLDLRSPRFQAILKLWFEFVYEAMQKSGLGNQEIDVVFNTMKADMAEWEKLRIDATG
jgi:hypothetical protein